MYTCKAGGTLKCRFSDRFGRQWNRQEIPNFDLNKDELTLVLFSMSSPLSESLMQEPAFEKPISSSRAISVSSMSSPSMSLSPLSPDMWSSSSSCLLSSELRDKRSWPKLSASSNVCRVPEGDSSFCLLCSFSEWKSSELNVSIVLNSCETSN